MIRREAIENLHTAFNEFAPDAGAQAAFNQMRYEMERAGESEEAVAVAMCSCLLDGLRHGNWPTPR